MSDQSVPSSSDADEIQAEVLTRISIFLTPTSAGLVSLALAGRR
jgi:hypothetical protein